MKRSKAKSRWPIIIILVLASAITCLGYKYLLPKPQSPKIFEVSGPAPLPFGQATLTGKLFKDGPAGSPGHFLLSLSSGPVLRLNTSKNFDYLLTKTVVVTGVVSPAGGDSPLPTMTVTTLTESK